MIGFVSLHGNERCLGVAISEKGEERAQGARTGGRGGPRQVAEPGGGPGEGGNVPAAPRLPLHKLQHLPCTFNKLFHVTRFPLPRLVMARNSAAPALMV